MVVLIVGLGPGADGNVWIFEIEVTVLGHKVFMLKFMYAFLTGRIPGDYNYLSPSISILTSKSANLILFLRSTF